MVGAPRIPVDGKPAVNGTCARGMDSDGRACGFGRTDAADTILEFTQLKAALIDEQLIRDLHRDTMVSAKQIW